MARLALCDILAIERCSDPPSANPQSEIRNPQSRPPATPIGFVFPPTLVLGPKTGQIAFVWRSVHKPAAFDWREASASNDE
jgi:hypothetical protein